MLEAGQRALINVHLRVVIPDGYYGTISGRSGLANSKGVVAFPGTTDAGYRGKLCVILFKFGQDRYKVDKGNRIAQLIIRKCYDVYFVLYDDTEFTKYCNTERGIGGFGSSSGF